MPFPTLLDRVNVGFGLTTGGRGVAGALLESGMAAADSAALVAEEGLSLAAVETVVVDLAGSLMLRGIIRLVCWLPLLGAEAGGDGNVAVGAVG
jgi:hypothetical protein